MCALYVASDIGGTFTDTVVLDEHGYVGRYKSSSVPEDPAMGVIESLRIAAEEKNSSLEDLIQDIALFAHGTTVATNALLEHRHSRVGLIQTKGFGDTLSIMRGFKSLGLEEHEIKNYKNMVKQAPVVSKGFIAEVSERIDYEGRVVMPLDEEDVRRAVRELIDKNVEVFAVSLLWSFRNNRHEKRIAEIIDEEQPGSIVTLSSDILPRLGEYARTVTTAINASVRPVISTAMKSLDHRLESIGLKNEPVIMQSNGGVCAISEIERQAASTLMSGPVGGIIASAYLGEKLNKKNIIATDMGGTSFEVGLVLNGQPVMSHVTSIGRNDIALPSVSIKTIGAGGGSIASVKNGLLQVGPESAGAQPGPACYGRGGNLPTVADADVVLGYLNPKNFLNGRMDLDYDAAYQAIKEHVADPLGISVEDAAEGIKLIVDNRMADLIRQATIQQGWNPSDFTLFAYGGAGPSHAFSYGAELGISEIIVPFSASVHSALGVLASDSTAVEEISEPMKTPPGITAYAEHLDVSRINEIFNQLKQKTLSRLKKTGVEEEQCEFLLSVEIQFRFQIHALSVTVDDFPLNEQKINGLIEKFIKQYEARFGEGSAFKAAGVELTTFRVMAKGTNKNISLQHLDQQSDDVISSPLVERKIFQNGNWKSAKIYNSSNLSTGMEIEGLAVIEMPDTTIVIGEHQNAIVDEYGSMIISLNSK